MPCTPAKARKLLRAGKAKVITYRPFTIQLTWQCEGQVQPVTCGIDKGSSTTGLACVGNDQVLLAAEIHHRRDVKNKMDDRRDRRKSRRARQWYRPKRFLNRATNRRSERLPPSIKTNVEEVIRVVRQIPLLFRLSSSRMSRWTSPDSITRNWKGAGTKLQRGWTKICVLPA